MLNIAFYRVITHVAIVKVTHDRTDGFMEELESDN